MSTSMGVLLVGPEEDARVSMASDCEDAGAGEEGLPGLAKALTPTISVTLALDRSTSGGWAVGTCCLSATKISAWTRGTSWLEVALGDVTRSRMGEEQDLVSSSSFKLSSFNSLVLA